VCDPLNEILERRDIVLSPGKPIMMTVQVSHKLERLGEIASIYRQPGSTAINRV
jgi:hypothetical protein